jgi:hypothetical protein
VEESHSTNKFSRGHTDTTQWINPLNLKVNYEPFINKAQESPRCCNIVPDTGKAISEHRISQNTKEKPAKSKISREHTWTIYEQN